MQAKSPGRLVGDAMDALDYPSTEDEIKETHGEGDTTYDDEEAEDYHIERYLNE